MTEHGATATWDMLIWATPRPGLTLDQLEQRMHEIGNTVLQRDTENNQLLIGQVSEQVAVPKGFAW